ncbi:MAG: EamA family transporter [Phycisphaerales bacterium]
MPNPPNHRFQVVAAFAAIYVLWGSTYLGIKVAVEAMPPFFMAGSRFMLAGFLLLGWMAAQPASRGGGSAALRSMLAPAPLVRAATIGLLMLGIGNGCVVWAISHRAPTGLTAVMIATTPLWLVLLDWLGAARSGHRAPIAPRVVVGLAVGVVGIVVLRGVGFEAAAGLDGPIVPVLLAASLAWACGSVLSKRSRADGSPFVATGLQMVLGGAAVTLFSALTEHWGTIEPSAFTLRSWLGFGYLVVFGSLVGYTAFIWLLRHVSAAAVGTYAYVNPVVAVVLGAIIADEPLTPRTIVASAIILAAVVLITTARARPAATADASVDGAEPA